MVVSWEQKEFLENQSTQQKFPEAKMSKFSKILIPTKSPSMFSSIALDTVNFFFLNELTSHFQNFKIYTQGVYKEVRSTFMYLGREEKNKKRSFHYFLLLPQYFFLSLAHSLTYCPVVNDTTNFFFSECSHPYKGLNGNYQLNFSFIIPVKK